MQSARLVRTTAAAVLVGLVLAGCAETAQQAAQHGGLAPAARVDAALSSVLDTERLTVTAGLDLDDTTRAALVDLAVQDGELTAAGIERLLGARVVATAVSEQGPLSGVELSLDPASVPAVSTSLALEVDGGYVVVLRQVEQTLYARADLSALGELTGQDELVEDLTGGLDEESPAVGSAVEAIASGGWVSLDTVVLGEQVAELTSAFGAPAPTSSPDTARATAALDGFLSDAVAVLRKEVVVTETGEDAYDVTAPLDKIVTSLTPSLTALVGELLSTVDVPAGFDGSGAEGTDPDAMLQEMTAEIQRGLEDLQDELEGRTATVQVGLDGDRLASARFDLAQLVDDETRADMAADGVESLPVLLTFEAAGEVAVPEGVTELDTAGLFDAFMGLGEGGSVGPDELLPGKEPFAGLTAEDLGMTEEELEHLREEMGLLPTP